MDSIALRKAVEDTVRDFYREVHEKGSSGFIPGQSMIPVSGKVFDAEDMTAMMEAVLDFWLTTGRFAAAFEKDFSKLLGRKHTILCNSGSSANLLAISCLTSPKLKDRQLKTGDEVITIAAGFPTTVGPIVQNGLTPVFLDVQIPTYNVDVSYLGEALSDRTRAVFLPHTLGNPFDIDMIIDFCRHHDLWLIEDNCDALGSLYRIKNSEHSDGMSRYTGTFGHMATFSFYPAHHITMGEGGAVATDDSELKKLIESFRDWGRDCWCETGHNNTCGKRFDKQLGDLPHGYDHKYTYSHVGYNLKITDMQAALGVSQLQKLPRFIEVRKKNYQALREGLKDLQEFFVLPESTTNSDPSWFGFPLAVKESAPFSRNDLIHHLNECRIDTRLLFGGNLLRQPAFQRINCRKVGELVNSDFVMNNVFWLGVYPGLTKEMLEYMIHSIGEFVRKK